MGGGQGVFAGLDPLWAEGEHTADFVFDDGRRLEGTFRGLCPQHGVLTYADGRRLRVTYSGYAASSGPQTSIRGDLLRLFAHNTLTQKPELQLPESLCPNPYQDIL